MRHSDSEKKNNTLKFVMILLIIIVVAAGVLAAKIFVDKKNTEDVASNNGPDGDDTINVALDKKEVQIFKSNKRPIAVMIDNVGKDAWPQSGLNEAFIVYEIVVEGGISRIMAVFKETVPEEIGPVRSARPYYLDYALENDAIYVHFGHSYQAADDIKSLDVDDIEGLYDDNAFWRTRDLIAPHNAMTSAERINASIAKNKYRTTSSDKGLLQYVTDEFDLDPIYEEETSDLENTVDVVSEDIPKTILNTANNIKVTYSTSHSTSYTYDSENKVYKRFMRGTPHTDKITKEQYTAKNIIVQFVKNSALIDSRETPTSGHQKLSTVGSGDGYFFTNGRYIEIKWSKSSRSAKTKYTDLDGNVIDVNDGITYIQITPEGQKVTIE